MKLKNIFKNLFRTKTPIVSVINTNEWQPIATAAKPETKKHEKGEIFEPILLCVAGEEHTLIGGYITSKDAFWTPQRKFAPYTHWMPLPKPPAKRLDSLK